MKIELTEFEGSYVKQIARKYLKETGDNYSIRFIMAMLAQKYEQTLLKDLEEILDEKIERYEEEKVIKKKQ